MAIYHYEVNDGGRLVFETAQSCDEKLNLLATFCAEDYHRNHGGWEAAWPVDMTIFRYSSLDEGPVLWRGSVEREGRERKGMYTKNTVSGKVSYLKHTSSRSDSISPRLRFPQAIMHGPHTRR